MDAQDLKRVVFAEKRAQMVQAAQTGALTPEQLRHEREYLLKLGNAMDNAPLGMTLAIVDRGADKAGKAIMVLDVMLGSPAARAGIRMGATLLTLDGRAIYPFDDFPTLLEHCYTSRPLTLTFRNPNAVPPMLGAGSPRSARNLLQQSARSLLSSVEVSSVGQNATWNAISHSSRPRPVRARSESRS